MLVLLIILVPTLNADTFVSNDNILISSSVHDFFQHYFDEFDTYKYFAYSCGDRTCYYGINQDNEFVRLYYTGNYGSSLQIQSGIDDNFEVSGVNVFIHNVSSETQLLIGFTFCFLIFLFLKLIGGGIRAK